MVWWLSETFKMANIDKTLENKAEWSGVLQ